MNKERVVEFGPRSGSLIRVKNPTSCTIVCERNLDRNQQKSDDDLMSKKADIPAIRLAMAFVVSAPLLVSVPAFAAQKQPKAGVDKPVIVATLQDPVTVVLPTTATARGVGPRVSVPLAQPVSPASGMVLSVPPQEGPLNLSVDTFELAARSSPPVPMALKLLPGTVEYKAQPLPQRKSSKNQNAEVSPMLKSTTNTDDPNSKGSFLDKHAVGFTINSSF